jgi:hypothetical protein
MLSLPPSRVELVHKPDDRAKHFRHRTSPATRRASYCLCTTPPARFSPCVGCWIRSPKVRGALDLAALKPGAAGSTTEQWLRRWPRPPASSGVGDGLILRRAAAASPLSLMAAWQVRFEGDHGLEEIDDGVGGESVRFCSCFVECLIWHKDFDLRHCDMVLDL